MIQLKRKEAIRLIKYHHLLHLSNEEKADIISDYNSKIKVYDKSNSLDFKEIQKYSNNKYILDRFSYNDLVTNEYIEEIFFALYNIHIELIDKPVSLLGYCCPCCNYKVYRKMEIFDICPVCMWENTNTGEDQYSAPNRSTLKEYRQAFLDNQKLEPNNLKYIQYELGSI